MYMLRKCLDFAGVALLLSLLYMLWILYKGPLSVPFLKPYIMEALNSGETEYQMSIGEVNLELVRSIQPVRIIAKDVRFQQKNDRFSLSAPELSLSFSVRALLKGMIAPSSVTVENPQVSIFTTYGVEEDKANEVNKKKLTFYFEWFEDFLERFNSTEKIYPESYINDIDINNAEVEFHEIDLGRKWLVKDVNFTFDRNLTDLEISTEGVFDLKDRLSSVALEARYRPFGDKLNVGFKFSDMVVSDIIQNLSPDMPQIDVPIEGKISADIDFSAVLKHKDDLVNSLDQAIEKIAFEVRGDDGEVIFDDNERFNYKIDSFVLGGTISGDLNSIAVRNADFEIGGQKTRLSLDVSGYKKYLFEKSLKDLKIVFSSEIDRFQLDDLSKFWPRYLAEPAWQWCKENLYGGYAQNGKFSFVFSYDDAKKTVYLSSLSGQAELVDGNISYLEGMPAVNNVYGTAYFTDSSIEIKADKGVSDNVIITGGSVRLYDLDKENNYIDIKIEGNSTVSDALRFIDHDPLNYAREMGIDPSAIGGNVDISLGLNFELKQDLDAKDIKVDIKADLSDVKVEKILDGKNLVADKMALEVNQKGFIIIGEAKFDGIPFNLVVNETFANRAYKGKAKVTFRLDEAVKKKLKLDQAILNPPYIEGYADITADLTVQNNDSARIDLEADITPTAIDYSFLGFKKEPNKWGRIKMTLEYADKKIRKIPSFSLGKSDFTLAGNMSFYNNGSLKQVDIDTIKGPKTSAKAKIDVGSGKTTKLKVNVSGNSYDLTELFAQSEKRSKKADPALETDDDDLASVPDTDIFITVNSLWTNPDTPIKNFAGSATMRHGVGFEEVHIVGNYGTDKSIKLKLDYIPRPNGEYLLSVDSNNAGSTLRVLRLYENMKGGILKIEARRKKDKSFIGHAQIRDFSIRNTPLLAKLLSVASLSGMVNLLTGEGIAFSHFDAPFEYAHKTLKVTDGKMFGNVIGFTGEGTYRRNTETLDLKGIISPAYSLNSMLGKIPLVGSVLAGKDGTVFAVSYEITGTLSEPEISINPLSVLSPNSLKELFSSGE